MRVDTSFAPNIPTYVMDLLLVGNKLYVVGPFGQVNGVQRRGAAVLDKGTGALDPTFNPERAVAGQHAWPSTRPAAGCTSAWPATPVRSCST